MSPKASATAMILLLVVCIISLGAISAFVKIQLQAADQDDNGITGMAVQDPEPESPEELKDTTPPEAPKFSIS